MTIYFVSALLIAIVVHQLGTYVTIVSLMLTVGKIAVVFAVLVASVLLWKWYKGIGRGIKIIGRS